ncbi:MAG: hypothetical protein GXO07_05150 [Crenarchaeota archaeon]|nr:hypothetical protein [Thermoproteota archaeon]
MPVLLKDYQELESRVLDKTKNVRKIKVTKAPDYSKVKVITRRMYVIIVKTEELDQVLSNIKEKLGAEELNVELYEVKKPLYKNA